MRKRVFVPNRGAHDFTGALAFGDLVFLSEGSVNKFALDTFYRTCIDGMKGATEEDYLMITSLNSLCVVAACILALKFGGRINFLLFRAGKYVERKMDFSALLHLI